MFSITLAINWSIEEPTLDSKRYNCRHYTVSMPCVRLYVWAVCNAVIRRYCRRTLHHGQEWRDIVNDTFIKLTKTVILLRMVVGTTARIRAIHWLLYRIGSSGYRYGIFQPIIRRETTRWRKTLINIVCECSVAIWPQLKSTTILLHKRSSATANVYRKLKLTLIR